MPSPWADEVRRLDRERYALAVLAPPDRQDDLMALLAFHLDLASIPDKVKEPMLANLRRQWWRDALASVKEGGAEPSPLAGALGQAIARHDLSRPLFEAMIEARAADQAPEPPARLEDLVAYARATGGGLARLMAEILGGRDERSAQAAQGAGTAHALLGLMRALPHHAARGRRHLPSDLLPEPIAGPSPRLAQAVRVVAEAARSLIAEARAPPVPKAVLPALLAARQAEGTLRDLGRVKFDVYDPRLARPRPRPLALLIGMLQGRP
ncbi:MAG: squalene/phytoene synthase family protein [Rhodospirillales bacterium]|nr:squalene/phytoene synthase family protein [Rhodospirillales bacterium]